MTTQRTENPRGTGRGNLRRRPWTVALLASAVTVTALTGCGIDQGNYLQSPDGALIVEIPSSWERIDADAVFAPVVERVPPVDGLVLSHWVAGFSAVTGSAPGRMFSGDTANVGGVVRTRHLLPAELELDALSVNSLIGQFNDLALLPNGTELLEQRNQRGLTFAGTVNGLSAEFEFATPNGRAVVRYVVAVDVRRGQLHSLAVGCSAECYEANQSVIWQIADSFTIVEKAPARPR